MHTYSSENSATIITTDEIIEWMNTAEINEGNNMETTQQSVNSLFVNCQDDAAADYEQEVDDILKLTKNIESVEPYYIHNSQFKCSEFLHVKCGLSAMKNFQPSVTLQNATVGKNMTFDSFEWQSFVLKMETAFREFFDNTEVGENYYLPVLGNIQLKGIIPSFCFQTGLDDVKFLQISKNGVDNDLQLTREEVLNILALDYLLSANIELLESLNFSHYYFKVLEMISEILRTYDNVNPLFLLENFSSLTHNSIHSYCFRECLFYIKDKVLHDLDTLKNYI